MTHLQLVRDASSLGALDRAAAPLASAIPTPSRALSAGLGGAPRVALIGAPTPVEPAPALGRALGLSELWVKREDRTAAGYGGNKVRNLEYLLGAALARGRRGVVTLAPLGSNFVAALADQARRVGLAVDVAHFVALRNAQIDAHAAFSRARGAALHVLPETLPRAVAAAGALALARRIALVRRAAFIAPGGTEVRGVLGHVEAALELARQIAAGAMPMPRHLVVGVGTCGTMAGLLVGFALAGLSLRIVGVRCVDRILCHPRKILRLANATARYLGEPPVAASVATWRGDLGAHRLLDPLAFDPATGDAPTLAYAAAHPQAALVSSLAAQHAALTLDSTYTTKVVATLRALAAREAELAAGPTLYWHTFSPTAMQDAVTPSLSRP
jgi:D-cysteine desulfhydrase